MKKYFIFSLLIILIGSTNHVVANQTPPLNAEAKATLIKELTIKLHALIKELNVILDKQDSVIRSEASNSLVSAELLYTTHMKTGYVGACKDALARIVNSSAVKKAGMTITGSRIACFDSKNSFALTIKNSKGYSCADSTGVMKTTMTPVVTTVCPVQ